MKIFKRVKVSSVAFLLIVSLLICSLPILSASSLSDHLVITENGVQIAETTVRPAVNRTLSVDLSKCGAESCQWQLYSAQAQVWVNINGKTQKDIEVSYAMLQNIQCDGAANIRCVAQAKDGTVLSSSAVKINLGDQLETPEEEQKTSALSVNTPARALKLGAAPEKALAYTVTITYVYDTPNDTHLDKTAAYQPYIVTVLNEEDFTKEVKINVEPRPIKGFDTYVLYPGAQDYVKSNVVKTTFTDLSENKVIKVAYRPGVVNYAYKVFFQNTTNDEYTEVPSLAGTMQGEALTETDNTAVVNKIVATGKTAGLRVLPSEKQIISADGSTIVRIYFDRLYYLMFFDLDAGGFGTDAVYAKFDQSVKVKDPTRPGYVFQGWSKTKDRATVDVADISSSDYIEFKVPVAQTVGETGVKATYYFAVWATTYANYTVIYWLENADDYNYVYGGSSVGQAYSNTRISGKDAPAFAGEDASHFTYFDARSDQNVLVEGDGSTILNVYYVRKMNTIEYHWNGHVSPAHTHDAVNAANTNNFTSKFTTNGCYMQDCDVKETHTHTAECLACGLTEHTHTAACCGLEVHAHTDACAGTCVHTSHTKACYGISETATAVSLSADSEPLKYFTQLGLQNGYIYLFEDDVLIGSTTYKYYLYFGGKWYRYQTNPTSSDYIKGTAIQTVECSDEGWLHATDTFYKYASQAICAHVHVDACYSCGKPAHDHTSGCNGENCAYGYEHAHTQNCYDCGYVNHVHTSACYRLVCNTVQSAAKNSTYAYSQAKYGADLGIAKDYAGNPVWKVDQVWAVESDGSPFYTSPPTIRENLYLYQKSSSGTAYIYYREKGTSTDIKPMFTFPDSGWSWTSEDNIEIPGFTYDSRSNSSGRYYLYYTRNSYTIEFSDGFSNVIHKTKVAYDKSFEAATQYVPADSDYPESLEAGAYRFEGWYLDPSFSPSSKFDMTQYGGKMPHHDFMVYAKWVPVKHTVRFFETAACTTPIAKTLNPESQWVDFVQPSPVDHGGYIPNKNIPILQKAGLTFGGWFYYDSGVKTAFDPANMPIKKAIDLYPEWTSDVLVAYEVKYMLMKDDHGELVETDIELAAPTTGEMYVGNSRLFYAKGQPNWYPQYRPDSYFPLVASHNIEMSADASQNVYTFWYAEKTDPVHYIVNYRDAKTGELLPQSVTGTLDNPKISGTEDVVVYEVAPEIKGYLPDAFGKTLIVTYYEENNVLDFYYTPNTTHSYYHVKYLYQNVTRDGYTESRAVDYLEKKGDPIDAQALTDDGAITGFKFVPAKTVVNDAVTGKIPETVPESNCSITLYYDREAVNYVVKYLDESGKPLAKEETKSSYYGLTVNETAKSIDGYQPTAPTKELKVTMTAADNVIIFTYTVGTAQIAYRRIVEGADGKYTVIDPADTTFALGTLSLSADTVSAFDGTPEGSTAIAGKGYQFLGWYVLDESGDITITTDKGDKKARLVKSSDYVTITGNKLVPTKNTAKTPALFEDATYYACFGQQFVDVTITRTNFNAKDDTEFIYHIVGGTTDLYVTVTKDRPTVTIKDVPVGDYTITEQTGWSWRYQGGSKNETITKENHSFTFNGAYQPSKWISAVKSIINKFLGSN